MKQQNNLNLQTNFFDDFFYLPVWEKPLARGAATTAVVYGTGYLIGRGMGKISPHGAGCLAVVALGVEFAANRVFTLANNVLGKTETWSGVALFSLCLELLSIAFKPVIEKVQKATHSFFLLFLAPASTVRVILNTDDYLEFAEWQTKNAMLKSFLTEPVALFAGFVVTANGKSEYQPALQVICAIAAVATVKLEAVAHENIENNKLPTTRLKKLAITLLPGLTVCTLIGFNPVFNSRFAGFSSCLLAQLTAMRISRIFC